MTRFHIRQRLRRVALGKHQQLRSRLYDLFEGNGFPDYKEQLRQAQLACSAAQPDAEWEGYAETGEDVVVWEVEKPSWTRKNRRCLDDEVEYVPTVVAFMERSDLEKYILGKAPGEAANGYQFEDELMAGCRDEHGAVNCPREPDACEHVPKTGCPQLKDDP